MVSVSLPAAARSTERLASSTFMRTAAGQWREKAAWMGSTASGVAWMSAILGPGVVMAGNRSPAWPGRREGKCPCHGTIASPARGPAMNDLPALAAEAAPTGTLRVSINVGNPILARRADDGAAGVSVDL